MLARPLPDGGTIRLIDFGTARDLGAGAKERGVAKTKVYTEGYAPPEQVVGKPEPRSDLFALAGTLYHLLTGKSPEGFYTARELETQLAEQVASLHAVDLNPRLTRGPYPDRIRYVVGDFLHSTLPGNTFSAMSQPKSTSH